MRFGHETARTALVAIALTAFVGCASLFHFSDPTTQAVSCDVASSELPIIEGAAAVCGPFAPACLSALEAIFGLACTDAAKAGKSQQDAHQAGIDAVNRHASAMKDKLARAGVKVQP